ncbi:MAG: hypothetical protein MI748_17860 [Opitutales bacterium]|nr:hypothetical protein [Opitutales bacterium]
MKTIIFCILFLCQVISTFACTIFSWTEGDRVLAANNEDWSNPKTRVWFYPAEDGKYGRMFVGFNDFFGQGGMNDQRLFYDWVAGSQTKWKKDKNKQTFDAPSEVMLERCATVEEAIEFYTLTNEPGFSYARIMVADASGASAIMGYRGGEFFVDRGKGGFQVFGFGRKQVDEVLQEDIAEADVVSRASNALKEAMQRGKYPTQYSNVCDLTAGVMWIYDFRRSETPFLLSLEEELAKGRHYYDIPELESQIGEPLRDIKKPSWWDRLF